MRGRRPSPRRIAWASTSGNRPSKVCRIAAMPLALGRGRRHGSPPPSGSAGRPASTGGRPRSRQRPWSRSGPARAGDRGLGAGNGRCPSLGTPPAVKCCRFWAATMATGLAVGAQVHETDLAQVGLADDVQRAGKLPAVDRRLLVLFDELELLDAGADRGLPREAVAGRDDDLLGRRRVAGDDAGGQKLSVVHPDLVGMAHAAGHVVPEADRPVLRRDRHAGQVHHHRIPPAGDPHRPAGVGDHREPRQPRACSRQSPGGSAASMAIAPARKRLSRPDLRSSRCQELFGASSMEFHSPPPDRRALLVWPMDWSVPLRRCASGLRPNCSISGVSLARWRSSLSQSRPCWAYS